MNAPRISIAASRAAYVGPGLELAPHRNAAATVAIALEAPFSLSLSKAAHRRRSIALIPPNTLHHLQAKGPMAFVYLDALSDDHRRFRVMDLEAARRRLTAPTWNVDELCAELGVPPRPPRDARVSAVVRALETRPQRFRTVRDAAAGAGLSASRFQAVFTEALGVPFRRYRTWRRMALVLKVLSKGRSLTEAAQEAGFSSSAHLSTAFRGLFGLAPSRLLALGVQVDFVSP